ncbi:hypothetical protein JXA12_02255 [Candidatus Woesearchaeota archaeon]|nr:hypothetical protein [Candidatus Woesearchaeota archaeon]
MKLSAIIQKRFSRTITATLLLILGVSFIIAPLIFPSAAEFMSIFAPLLLIPAGILIGINKWEKRLANLITQDITALNRVWFSADMRTVLISTIATEIKDYEVQGIHLCKNSTRMPDDEALAASVKTIVGDDRQSM